MLMLPAVLLVHAIVVKHVDASANPELIALLEQAIAESEVDEIAIR